MRAVHRRSRALALSCLAAAWLAGCSATDVSHAEHYPPNGQQTVGAIRDWDLLAQDVARRVSERIATWPRGEHPIHVTAAGNTDFNQGLVKLLRVHLLEHGVSLSAVPTAVELQVRTQVVRHGASGSARTELLVTTVLKNEDRYLTGTADMPAIESADASLYEPPPPVKTWTVVTP